MFRDTKRVTGLVACQGRVDQAMVRHVALLQGTLPVDPLRIMLLADESVDGQIVDRREERLDP